MTCGTIMGDLRGIGGLDRRTWGSDNEEEEELRKVREIGTLPSERWREGTLKEDDGVDCKGGELSGL